MFGCRLTIFIRIFQCVRRMNRDARRDKPKSNWFRIIGVIMVFLIAIVIMMPDSKRVIVNKQMTENRGGSRCYELVSCVEINASISNRVTLLRCIR